MYWGFFVLFPPIILAPDLNVECSMITNILLLNILMTNTSIAFNWCNWCEAKPWLEQKIYIYIYGLDTTIIPVNCLQLESRIIFQYYLSLGYVFMRVLGTKWVKIRENVQLHNKNSPGGSLVGVPYASLESIPLIELLSLKKVLSFVYAVLYGFHCLPLQHDLCQKV